MKNGFRNAPQGSKKEQIKGMETEMKNLQMAGRISQMMTQQLMETVKSMSNDLGSALNQLYELQYKYTAIQKHLALPITALNDIANEQRLSDFDVASIAADRKEGLTPADVVSADSTITITSVATDENGTDKGIFRSRVKLTECGVPELITALTDQPVNTTVSVTLNGLKHDITLLSIRNPVPAVEVSQVEAISVEVQ